jgi:hypothetical protein
VSQQPLSTATSLASSLNSHSKFRSLQYYRTNCYGGKKFVPCASQDLVFAVYAFWKSLENSMFGKSYALRREKSCQY